MPFRIKWVNDTHALVIFPSSAEGWQSLMVMLQSTPWHSVWFLFVYFDSIASSVAKVPFAKLKVKVLRTGNHPESVAVAEKIAGKNSILLHF